MCPVTEQTSSSQDVAGRWNGVDVAFGEQGARLKTQGQTLMITNTIPIGVKIPGRHE